MKAMMIMMQATEELICILCTQLAFFRTVYSTLMQFLKSQHFIQIPAMNNPNNEEDEKNNMHRIFSTNEI